MIYYCDTEFTSFQGELISIALVPENAHAKLPFYVELKYDEKKVDPWVKQNVVSKLSSEPISRREASLALYEYLKEDDDVTVIADWPEDLAHFYNLIIIGHGQMVSLNNITTKLKRTKWAVSDIPHHALYDACAMRNYWVNKND